ncbi:hypothetical protein Tco_1254216 [Tanacetum coccineum]
MAAVEVPQNLEYMGGQLNATPVLEVEIFNNWKKRFMRHIIAKSTWDDLILYHEGPSNVKESRWQVRGTVASVRGTVAVRGGRHVSTRYCSDDGWTNPRVTRGTGVCQSEVL